MCLQAISMSVSLYKGCKPPAEGMEEGSSVPAAFYYISKLRKECINNYALVSFYSCKYNLRII